MYFLCENLKEGERVSIQKDGGGVSGAFCVESKAEIAKQVTAVLICAQFGLWQTVGGTVEQQHLCFC